MKRTFTRWTEAETALARKSMNLSPDLFLRRVGRTKSAARNHLKYMDDPAFREQMALRSLERKVEKKARDADLRLALPAKNTPPPDVLADAVRRAMAPRSLTSLLLGDPAPGASALDRRNEARV